jgi:hypothetical protein
LRIAVISIACLARMPTRARGAPPRWGFAATLRHWQACLWPTWLFDDYRPELHYMRGPGPKWREKNRPDPAA